MRKRSVKSNSLVFITILLVLAATALFVPIGAAAEPSEEMMMVLAQSDITGTAYYTRLALALFGPLLNVFILGFLWKTRYPNQARLVPTVNFYPPEGLNPTEMGYVIDGHVNVQDIGALVIYWASKGYLRINEERSSQFTLEKLKDMGDEQPLYEQYAFRALWRLGDGTCVKSSEIKNNYFRQVRDIWNSIRQKYEQPEVRIFEKTARGPLFMMTALCLLDLDLMVSSSAFNSTFVMFSMLAIAMIFTVGYTFMFLALEATYKYRYIRKPWQTWLSYGLISIVFFGAAGLCVWAQKDIVSIIVTIVLLIMLMLDAFAVLRFKRYTEYGFGLLEKAVGFRQFIKNAEQDRLETLKSDDPDYVYRILPYAIVLKVSKAWASRLRILSAQQPDWYWRFGSGTFTSKAVVDHMAKTGSFISNTAVSKSPLQKRR